MVNFMFDWIGSRLDDDYYWELVKFIICFE